MRVLVVGKVVVDVGFAVDPLGAGDPSGEALGDGSMMNPGLHIPALPGMIAALAFLQPPRRVVLVLIRRGLQGSIEALKLGWFRSEGSLWFLALLALRLQAAVAAEHPVVARTHGEKDGGIAQVGRSEVFDRVPVLPDGGLPDDQGGSRALLVELVDPGPEATRLAGGFGHAAADDDTLGCGNSLLPIGLGSDGEWIGGEEGGGQQEGSQTCRDDLHKAMLGQVTSSASR